VTPIVVKLGGSVITNKKVPFSYREKVVRALGRAMASSGVPVVLVHGGGSFGHTVAKKFGLSSSKSSPSSTGVSETREAMFALNNKLCASLSAVGLRPYTFSPFTMLNSDEGRPLIERLLASGMAPVTFGDVVRDNSGFRILSGDTICVELAGLLSAPRCVLSLDVDGVLDEKGAVIKELGAGAAARVVHQGTRSGNADATGGMAFKLKEAQRMASFGTEVRFVSGLRPKEFRKALKGSEFRGTTIRVPPVSPSSIRGRR